MNRTYQVIVFPVIIFPRNHCSLNLGYPMIVAVAHTHHLASILHQGLPNKTRLERRATIRSFKRLEEGFNLKQWTLQLWQGWKAVILPEAVQARTWLEKKHRFQRLTSKLVLKPCEQNHPKLLHNSWTDVGTCWKMLKPWNKPWTQSSPCAWGISIILTQIPQPANCKLRPSHAKSSWLPATEAAISAKQPT